MTLRPSRFLFWLFAAAGLASLGTTYVIKENGQEVGRYEEADGSDRVETVENDVKPEAAASAVPDAGGLVPTKSAPRYEWYHDSRGYEAAIKHHEQTGRPVFLYFHTTWCPVCREYDADVFAKNEIREYMAPYMKVRIDSEKEEKLATKYGVKSYPTFLVISQGQARKMALKSSVKSFLNEMRKAGLQ